MGLRLTNNNSNIMALDIRTPIEKERDAEHTRICDMYVELMAKFPKASPNRLFSVIAERCNKSVPGVRNILIKRNLYATK